MSAERRSAGKTPIATVTLVGTVPVVSAHVLTQLVLSFEVLLTQMAVVHHDPHMDGGVDLFVNLQTVLSQYLFLTDVAQNTTAIYVNLLVLVSCSHGVEVLLTITTMVQGADMDLSLVACQSVRQHELLVTEFTLERLLPGVDAHVTPQLKLTAQPTFTHITLERLLSAVRTDMLH